MKDPAIRFRIDFAEHNNLGPGKIALLEAVQATGSISDAARAMKMSYRRAWLLVSSVNAAFDEPATVAVTGGKGGGGARVTAFGCRLRSTVRSKPKLRNWQHGGWRRSCRTRPMQGLP